MIRRAGLGLALALLCACSPSRPYVISAIDYHFHDAHPTEELAPDREIVVSNQGRNVHNVTIEGTGYSVDVQPGERLSLGPAGVRFPPGRSAIVCRYHADRGMSGTILVAG